MQSGDSDRRGPLTKHGPTYLRWALFEATMHALRHPAYAARYQRRKKRLGKQRGAKVAQVDVARRLAHAICTCFLEVRSSLLEAPLFVWRADRPLLDMRPRANFRFRLILPPRRPWRHEGCLSHPETWKEDDWQ